MTEVELIQQIIRKYTDDTGHIVQRDRDGGDSLNRLGCFLSVASLESNDDEVRHAVAHIVAALMHNEDEGMQLLGQPARFCRNPTNPTRWCSNYNNTTRDQMQPVEAAWAIRGMQEMARRHFWQRIKRCFFHFSQENDGYDSGLPLIKKFPDAPTPTELGALFRATGYAALRPFLYILDAGLFIDALLSRYTNASSWDRDNQLLPCIIAAQKVWPTFLSRLTRRVYASAPVEARLRHYHSESNGANGIEPLGELMVLAYNKYIKEIV